MGIVHVEGDEIHGQHKENPDKLFHFDQLTEIERAEKLLSEAAVFAGLELRGVLHKEDRRDSEQNYETAHDHEQAHIIVAAADEHTADHRADDGADDGLGGKGGADGTAVLLGHHVVQPCVVARVIAHGAEEGHQRVGTDNSRRRKHQNLGGTRRLAAGDPFRRAEQNCEDAPEDVPDADEIFPLSHPVGQRSEQEGCNGGGDGRNGDHPGNDGGVLGDFCVYEGIEPLVFDVPA